MAILDVTHLSLILPIFSSESSVLLGKDGVREDRGLLGCLQRAHCPGFPQISSSRQQTALTSELLDSGCTMIKTPRMTESWPHGDTDDTGWLI